MDSPSCPLPVRSASGFPAPALDLQPGEGTPVAVLAGGCFWCVEAVYRALDGVTEVMSGYAGGDARLANYEAVCDGDTGHAEAVLIRFDPAKISFGELLRVFFAVAHDPTQKDRQGADVGTQYRSAIFPQDAAQQKVAEAYIVQLNTSGLFPRPLATTIEPDQEFHAGEKYHQDYAARNPNQPYIAFNALPKVEKLKKQFPEHIKK